ncbi:hypothetical protein BDN70DRAFT_989742 [Pholiota conissans]|uniref:DUF3533 domain-containing protein n=1 Tax=Pholiota conissans TaxID=109636 RepID=A0A9P5ZB90_9AGAR|nr:hypothetical protein BDN70DRAFT_989742 [Pholiota conissans]
MVTTSVASSSSGAPSSLSQRNLKGKAPVHATSTTNTGGAGFFDKNPQGAAARAAYLKIFLGGCFMILILIFGILSIFWGSLWKIPARNLHGWVVDFDGGLIGQTVSTALSAPSGVSKVTWTVVPASQFPGGAQEVGAAVLEEHTWAAVTINAGSTARLMQSLSSPNTTYDGRDAITAFGVEARNENAFRSLIQPTLLASLEGISKAFAIQVAQRASNATNLAALLAQSPQTITAPISYTIINLAPFNIPVATAVIFVGLIYQVILSFFVVMIGQSARDASGITQSLNTRSLIVLRFISSFAAYFFISLFYCLLSVAFQLGFSHKFGHSGFLVFWMLNYVGMLALGLSLEAMITLLTVRFIPFFMLTLIITNVSVCVFPIEILPSFFRYGYGMPFYNISHAMRTIVFATKNRGVLCSALFSNTEFLAFFLIVGFDFGILLIWVAISVVTLPLIQQLVRRRGWDQLAHPSSPTVPLADEEKDIGDVKVIDEKDVEAVDEKELLDDRV